MRDPERVCGELRAGRRTAPEARDAPRADDHSMNFIDRSPAGFITVAFVVVYSVIAVEIGMWMVSTAAAVAATFGVVLAGAVWIYRIAMHLLDDEEGVEENVPDRRARPGVVPSRPDEREGAVDATARCA